MSTLDIPAEQWLKECFEFEFCDECGGDAPHHTAVPVMGNWFARCNHPLRPSLTDEEAEKEMVRRREDMGNGKPLLPPPGDFEDMEAVSEDGRVRVVLGWLGEGMSGDWDPDDPQDSPLLRYDVFRKYLPGEKLDEMLLDDSTEVKDPDGEWRPISDGSYCTFLTAWDPKDYLARMLKGILDEVALHISDQARCKRLMERLSWTGNDEQEEAQGRPEPSPQG